jgi:hypothetical protein
MVAKHQAEAIVDPLVRFQVARLFQSVERVPAAATSLKVVVTCIKHCTLFASQVYDDPLDLGLTEPSEDLSGMHNPYGDESPRPDLELVSQAWRTQYGAEALADNFCPPMFLTADEGVLPAPWLGEFRDLMVRKYGSLKAAEPRIRFIMTGLIPSMVEERDSGLFQTRTIEERERIEALVDRVGRQTQGR